MKGIFVGSTMTRHEDVDSVYSEKTAELIYSKDLISGDHTPTPESVISYDDFCKVLNAIKKEVDSAISEIEEYHDSKSALGMLEVLSAKLY